MSSSDQSLKVWMIFEVMATERDTAESSLKEHVNKLDTIEGVELLESEYDDINEVEQPRPDVEKGYTQVCETEFEIRDLNLLIQVVLNYGPTMVEIMEPDKLELDQGELQDTVNLVAEMMQKYLHSGMGGVVISSGSDEISE